MLHFKNTYRQGGVRSLAFPYFLFLLLSSYSCRKGPPQLVFQGPTMGTSYTVKVCETNPLSQPEREIVSKRIQSELYLVNQKMSTYDENSELSRFNRHCKPDSFKLSEETENVLRRALEVSEITDGAFDVTVGPLVNAWGFGPDGRPEQIPDDETIKRLKSQIGYKNIVIQGGAVRKARGDLYCDLSAIAKGYAVDRVAEGLEQLGIQDYMVEVGGEVRTKGRNQEGNLWKIAIERPDPTGRAVLRVVLLKNKAMATSGDYRNFYEEVGTSFSHIIDPRTGRPITHPLASVSVIHEECVQADAYATALLVLGPEDGYALAERLDLAALFIIRDKEKGIVEKTTTSFDQL